MTLRCSATIPVHDVDVAESAEAVCQIDPSSAQLLLWHGQAQFDLGAISSRELAVLERTAGAAAGRARTIYNPYTGEIRRVFLPDWVGKHRPEDPAMVGWTQAKSQPRE